jgi:hypothetical protein
MIKFRYGIFICCIICSFMVSAHQIKAENKATRNFWHPAYLGERLDYCTFDGKECGKPVADRYCQLLGYDFSTQNVIAYNVGLTHFLSTRVACKGWRCNGFMTIGCATGLSHNPPKPYHYREKRFYHPRFNDYRVDWCLEHNKGCGAKAAYSFCNRMGFMSAKRYSKETHVRATKSIGSQELCFGNDCNAFDNIICYR